MAGPRRWATQRLLSGHGSVGLGPDFARCHRAHVQGSRGRPFVFGPRGRRSGYRERLAATSLHDRSHEGAAPPAASAALGQWLLRSPWPCQPARQPISIERAMSLHDRSHEGAGPPAASAALGQWLLRSAASRTNQAPIALTAALLFSVHDCAPPTGPPVDRHRAGHELARSLPRGRRPASHQRGPRSAAPPVTMGPANRPASRSASSRP